MTNVHDRWRQGLEAEARLVEFELPTHAAGPEVVMRRGHRRHRRNQVLASVTCLGLVAGSAAVWSVSRGDGGPANELRIADEPTGPAEPMVVPTTVGPGYLQVDPSTLPPVDLVPTTYQWGVRPVPFGQGVGPSFFGPATASPSGLVNVSTRPGVRRSGDGGDEGRALYTSDDGITWAGTSLDGSHWFGGVTRSPRGLVAVGTAAATAPIIKTSEYGGLGDVVVSTSGDGGATWDDLVLPIDLRGVYERASAAGTPIQLGVSSAKVVERDGVTTVAVGISGTPVDLGSLVPGGVDLGQGYALQPDGVLVLGPGGRLHTWAELRIDPEAAQWLGERTLLLRSTDGTTFTPRGEALRGYLFDLVPVGDRVAVVLGGLTDTVASSAGLTVVELDAGDGQRALPSLPFDGGYLAAGELSGTLAVAGNVRGWPALARWDGGDWRTTVLANGVFREGTSIGFGLAAVGAGGVGLLVDVFDDPSYGLAVGDNGFTLRSDGSQRGFSVVEDATGEVLGTLASLEAWAVPGGGRLRAVTASVPLPDDALVATTAAGPAVAVAAATTTTVVQAVGAGDEAGATTTVVAPGPGEYDQLVAIEVLDGDGAVVARLDVTALVRAMEEAWRTPAGAESPRPEVLLLHSADGAAWSSIDIGEAAGAAISMVTGVVSTADGLVVTASTTEADPDAPAPAEGAPDPIRRQVALVGTRS